MDNLNSYSKDFLINLYRTMLRIRIFEEKVADEIKLGNIITPCHLYIGEEAVATGVCANLNDDDIIYGNHRSHGHYLAKGGDMNELMAEIFCRKTGCSKGKGGSMHVVSKEKGIYGTPPIVAGTIPIATGSALVFSYFRSKKVSVVFFGDGATNEGVFYETLNFASLKKLPVIFVCENNQYSTHMPISSCLANTNIAEKGNMFCIPNSKIEGNNVLEVYNTAKIAIENARNGNGPWFIEAITYRWRGHVGPNYDIDKNLRSQDELNYWMSKCPIKQFSELLIKENITYTPELKEIKNNVISEVENALIFAKNSPYPDEEDLKKGVFGE